MFVEAGVRGRWRPTTPRLSWALRRWISIGGVKSFRMPAPETQRYVFFLVGAAADVSTVPCQSDHDAAWPIRFIRSSARSPFRR